MTREPQKEEAHPRILVVDDEEHLRSALKRWFEMRGFQVDVAEDGQEAVEKCGRNHYAAVTMDLEMPRMKGSQAIAAIRAEAPDLPIIVLTGYSSEGANALRCGANQVLSKPVSLRELEAEVRRAMGAQPATE